MKVIVFEDIFGSSNSGYIDQIFMRGRQNNLDLYYPSQSYFGLLKRAIRNKSYKLVLFNQTLKILRTNTEMLVVTIRVMMNSKIYVENRGKAIIIIFVLKREIKKQIIIVMKQKHFYRIMKSGNENFLINLNVVCN